MPLYEYECESCRQRFERIQRFSDPPVESCPACGAAVRKLPSSPAIQFKGSGWYITDYARKGDTKKADAGKDGGTGSDTSTDKGADRSDKSDKSDKGSEKSADKSTEKSAGKGGDKGGAKGAASADKPA